MKQRWNSKTRLVSFLCALVLFLEVPALLFGEPTTAALSAFDSYTHEVETRLAAQHRSAAGFLGVADSIAPTVARLRAGDLIIEKLTPPVNSFAEQGAMLHHWRGTAFVRGATAADFERLMRDFSSYPRHFAPEVERASATALPGGDLLASMRVRQRHVITVVMDTSYDVRFGQLDVRHGYSISRSTRIAEIAGAGTKSEHALSAADEHGFLWRLDTYWSYEERDGGLYMQIESVSLTRSIPRGLGWAIGPFVESVPRESLEFTLRSAANALRR